MYRDSNTEASKYVSIYGPIISMNDLIRSKFDQIIVGPKRLTGEILVKIGQSIVQE